MALRGNLKDFSLPDVFQLVTLSGKTGILRIRRADGAEGSVWFRDGDVFFAQSNWHREPLGERLVAASKITPSALARALETQKADGAGGRRLGRILVDDGYITDKVLEAFVQEQIQDTIFDLFRWDEGDFDFEPLEGAPDEDIGLSVSIENIVMEGSRRLEEWNRIKKKIPSTEIVFKMATAPGEGTFEISLKPVEWNLLLLVDGTRSVAELATDTNRTDFDVSRVLYGLFSAGLLEVASDAEVEKLRAERVRLEARAAELRAKARVAEPAPAPKPAAKAAPAPEAAPEAAADTVPVADAAGAAVPEAPHEVPTFLSDEAQAGASAEDMAVFEEMMGAVLQAPPEPEAPLPLAEPLPEPVAAAPEPEIVLPEPPAAFPEPPSAEPPAVEPAPEPPSAVEVPEPPAAEAAPEPPAAEAVVEIPVEVGSEAPAPPAVEMSAADFFVGEPEAPETKAELAPEPPAEEPVIVADPMSVLLPSEPALPDVIATDEQVEAPEAEEPPAEEPELTIAEIEAAARAAEAAAAAVELLPPPEDTDEPADQAVALLGLEDEGDLSDLLSALREEAEEPSASSEPVIAPEPPDDEHFVADREEDSVDGVISTDAFLSDFEAGGGGFGLGDELQALTGGGRARHAPTPAPAPVQTGGIHRDAGVDKDLVMKVIEGIKSL